MKIARIAPSIEVISEFVLLVGAFANITQICVRVKVTDKSKPALAARFGVRLFLQPAVSYSNDHREREHGRARRFGPGFRTINQLAPHSVLPLKSQEGLHHFAKPLQDARALWMILGKRTQQLRHSGSHPAIASAPEKRHVRRVIETSVALLQLVEICGHF